MIGWTVRESWFQRRAGLVTLTATTAVGLLGYRTTSARLHSEVDASHEVAVERVESAAEERTTM